MPPDLEGYLTQWCHLDARSRAHPSTSVAVHATGLPPEIRGPRQAHSRNHGAFAEAVRHHGNERGFRPCPNKPACGEVLVCEDLSRFQP